MTRWLRWLVSLGLIGLIIFYQGDTLGGILAETQLRWIALALLISIAQVVLSAWRWRYTALRLETALGLRTAIAEYYLAMLVNQLLPGGVLGDAQRAWRHARQTPEWQPAAQAVVIERVAGQLAIAIFILLSWPWLPGPVAEATADIGMLVLLALLTAFAVNRLLRPWLQATRLAVAVSDWIAAVRQALLSRQVLPVQLLLSILIGASYIAIYACCMLAIDASGGKTVWLPLLPLVLLAMLIPISAGGWGLREGAAALLWPIAGLPAAEGISAAILYGVVCLLASLPGIWVISRR